MKKEPLDTEIDNLNQDSAIDIIEKRKKILEQLKEESINTIEGNLNLDQKIELGYVDSENADYYINEYGEIIRPDRSK